MKKRILILLAVLLSVQIMLPAGTSCKRDKKPEADTTADGGTEDTTPVVNEDMYIIKDGKSDFKIVTARFANKVVKNASAAFSLALRDNYPKALLSRSDDLSNDGDGAYEILIGSTNRKESEIFLKTLGKNGYGYELTGNKLVIAGKSDALTAAAVDDFIRAYIDGKGAKEDSLILPFGTKVSKDAGGCHYGPLLKNYKNAEIIAHPSPKKADIEVVENYRTLQGGCFDGKYLYYAMMRNEGDLVQIYKIDTATWETVKVTEPLPLDHANDLCYNPDKNEILIVHNAPRRKMVSVMDPETLEIKGKIMLKFDIFCMSYNQKRHQYVIGLSGGENFAVLDENFNLVKRYLTLKNTTGYTTQGCECDDSFIYFVQYEKNVINIWDWNGKFVKQIELPIKGMEPENIALGGDRIYIAFNNARWMGAEVYYFKLYAKNQ